MSGIIISQTFTPPFEVKLDWMFGTVAGDPQDHRLANLVVIALNTDRRALPDDVLPNPGDDDRRGWWGDTDAASIWGGWPIGTRLWLLRRAKLPGGTREGLTVERARRYIREALDPIVTAKIASSYDLTLNQVGTERISGRLVVYRGPKSAIALEWQDLWRDFGG